MATIALITNETPENSPKSAVWQLLWRYRKKGNDARVINGTLFNLLGLLFKNADIYDFHGHKPAWIIPLLNIFQRNSAKVVSLRENDARRSIRRFVGIKFADQIITSSRSQQYQIYQHYKLLPSYIPEGVQLLEKTINPSTGSGLTVRNSNRLTVGAAKLVRQGKKNLNHFAIIAEEKQLKKILRQFKSKRIKLCLIDKNKIDSPETVITMKNSAGLLLFEHIASIDTLRELALYGLPIITIDSSLNREAFRDEASYIFKATPRTINTAIKALVKNYPRHRKDALKLQKFVANLFNWDVVANEYLFAYRKSESINIPVDSLIPSKTGI